MRIVFLIILAVLLNSLTLKSQSKRVGPGNSISIGLEFKVWNETEIDYKAFKRNQAAIRKDLDEQIDPEDFEKIDRLRMAYGLGLEKIETLFEDKDLTKAKDKEMAKLYFQKWKDRKFQQIRTTYNQFKDVQSLLTKDKEIMEVAKYLSQKYDAQIVPIRSRIEKAYQKLYDAERVVYIRNDGLEQQKYLEDKTNLKDKATNKLFENIRILLIESVE